MGTMTLYYQTYEDDNIPCWNFCSDAAIGARSLGVENIQTFYDVSNITNRSKYDIVVGSVEQVQKYFGTKFKPIEQPKTDVIGIECIKDINSEYYPCFIKPYNEIKAFTGFVAKNNQFANLLSGQYKGKVIVKKVEEYISEYRLYVRKDRYSLDNIFHYLGDPFVRPDKMYVGDRLKHYIDILKEKSFTLDFGITKQGITKLIEINDGWSIGNYGLSPEEYYLFVRDRFLQLQGVVK